MGAKHSSTPSLPDFRHAIILNGLEGSGKSTVQSALKLPDTRILEVDTRFLTTPQIYSTNDISARTGEYASNPLDFIDQTTTPNSVWLHSGRGSASAKWTTVAFKTKAIVFTIDASRRDKFAAPNDYKYLPREFVQSFDIKSEKDQDEIAQTLKSQMFAKDMLENLIEQENYQRKPILILLTHGDQPDAMTPQEVCEAMNLPTLLKFRDWRIASCNALTGEGMAESIDWLNYVISAPTDFNPAIKAEQQKLEKEAMRKNQDADPKVLWEEKHKLARLKQEERDRRFARGDVFQAPLLFRTNGKLWAPSEQQMREFVVAPLSGEHIHETLIKEQQAQIPIQNAVLAMETLEKIQDEKFDTTATSSSSSSASLASETETELSESSNADSTPRMKHHKQQMHQESFDAKTDKIFSSSSFSSSFVQSTTFPFPPRSLIPVAPPTKYHKKHFWSRRELIPDDQSGNIHEHNKRAVELHGWHAGMLQWHYIRRR